MSWELASFLILGAVLLAGFAWYERSRPPSQVVALVAALAALAIAGRIAFAAFPNVKPTTDIVIFAGYALGPAPGLRGRRPHRAGLQLLVRPGAVDALADGGLGAVRDARRGARRLGGRNVGRLTLAAVCGFAGVAYGALLNFSLMATYGGDLSLEHFLVLESRAVPFDAAHAIGNVVFALIAGPAMIRMLVRFRERFEWRRPGRWSAALLARPGPGRAPCRRAPRAADTASAGELAGSRCRTATAAGASSPGDGSSAEMTGWVMLGLEAAGRNPLDVSRGGNTPVDYLRSKVGSSRAPATSPARSSPSRAPASTRATSAAATWSPPWSQQRRDDGSFEGWPGTTAFAIIALRAAGATGGLDKSLAWLPKRRTTTAAGATSREARATPTAPAP